MKTYSFNRNYRTLGQVPRWAILRMTREQSVLEHTALVAYYAHNIADIINFEGDRGALLWEALSHDLPEVETGDLPSPIKGRITTPEILGEYEEHIMAKRFGVEEHTKDSSMHRIIKCADLLEAVLKLTEEKAAGNRSVGSVLAAMTDMLFSKADMLDPVGDLKNHIVKAIRDEFFGCDGVKSVTNEKAGSVFWMNLEHETDNHTS